MSGSSEILAPARHMKPSLQCQHRVHNEPSQMTHGTDPAPCAHLPCFISGPLILMGIDQLAVVGVSYPAKTVPPATRYPQGKGDRVVIRTL